MGSRGPLRNPHSTRGVRELAGWKPDSPQTPLPPGYLSAGEKKIFRDLVEDLKAAQVPLKSVDAAAIGMAALCLSEIRRATDPALRARFERDAQQWLSVIGATPKSRAQMGLRGLDAAETDPLTEAIFGDRK